MQYLLYHILELIIKYYAINSLSELKELLLIKKFRLVKKLRRNAIIIYEQQDQVFVDIVKYFDNQYVYLRFHKYVVLSNYFIVKFPVNKYRLIGVASLVVLKYSGYLYSLISLIMNFQLIMLIVVILLGVSLYYQRLLVIILPLLIVVNQILFTYGLVLLVTNKLYYYYLLMKLKDLFILNNITVVYRINIGSNVVVSPGIYFLEINNDDIIYINNINLKFINYYSLQAKVQFFYIFNENSFFTNKQKYSKIGEGNKFKIYLLEVD